MYFDFEDYRPDVQPVGRAISWREGVLISIIAHMAGVIVLLVAPDLLPAAARATPVALQTPAPDNDSTRYVFVEPRVDTPAPRPPERAPASDQDRVAQTPEPAPEPENLEPMSRGSTQEFVERREAEAARGQDPEPEPGGDQIPTDQAQVEPVDPDARRGLSLPSDRPPDLQARLGDRVRQPGGSLGDALQNLQRYVEPDQFENAQGGGAFGPALQFDTKGVEFGPWVRRFIAQVKRNWEPLIPLAAWGLRGHVVVTFNVHKNGLITDLSVIRPTSTEAFNTAAYGALASSSPTAPLPPEYPSDRAFFTVTFYYNEEPPR